MSSLALSKMIYYYANTDLYKNGIIIAQYLYHMHAASFFLFFIFSFLYPKFLNGGGVYYSISANITLLQGERDAFIHFPCNNLEN